ncbi:hypothetical protein Airi02_040360 [Actinoallomurus iriomotensis]|uniref:Uncharacterized protein n=1 Tax=Actinoallomurus iriomotensis TaxID=478107 RepID=A0A9W6W0U2_9ACTN|nr:hypothetical protein Airi02_040360 [Actinoallomurus iriomotensis]
MRSGLPRFDASNAEHNAALLEPIQRIAEAREATLAQIEPGFNPGTGLGRDANAAVRFLAKYVAAPLAPLIKYWSTPKRAAG